MFAAILCLICFLTGGVDAAYEEVLLKSGERVPRIVFTFVVTNGSRLLEENPELFGLALLEKAKDPDLELSPEQEEELNSYGLLKDGEMSHFVRTVILNFLEYDDPVESEYCGFRFGFIIDLVGNNISNRQDKLLDDQDSL